MAKLGVDVDLLAFGNEIMLSGVIFSGQGRYFVCAFPGEGDSLEEFVGGGDEEHLDMDLADWQALLRQTDILETEILEKAANGLVTKAVVRKSQRTIDAATSWAVYRRDGYRCRYCGRNDVPLTVDHLILWEEGGPSVEGNLLSCCKKDNKARGRKQYVDWLLSPYYKHISARLSPKERWENEALLKTLDSIPRVTYIRSR